MDMHPPKTRAKTPERNAPPWYVCLTKPRREDHAATRLREQGYEVYLPLIFHWVRRKGAWTRCRQAMFPRYLFLRCGRPNQGLAPVRSTPGVSALIRFGLLPATLDHITVEAIRQVERWHNSHTEHHSTPFQAGDSVIIGEGPLKGMSGIVSHVARERVLVLLTLLGREQEVSLPADHLLPTRG